MRSIIAPMVGVVLFVYGAHGQSTYNIRLTNENYPDATTLEVDLQIQTQSGNFNLGGTTGAFNISEIFIDYSPRASPPSSGEILLDAANCSHNLGAGYSVNFAEAIAGRARMRALYNNSTLFNVTTTFQTIATLSFDVGANSHTNQTYTMTPHTSTVVYDDSDVAQTQGTLTGFTNESLPVNLIRFDGMAIAPDRIKLNWVTGEEIDNEGFEIQRSNNGLDYTTLDFIDGQRNAKGNSYYEYIDHEVEPSSDLIYYRLKQVDYEGTFAYSDVLSVSKSPSNSLQVMPYPNPATGALTIELSEDAEVLLLDSRGNVVKYVNGAIRSKTFDVSELPRGLYFIEARQPHSDKRVIKKILLSE